MLARYMNINGVALNMETICALHIEVSPLFLRKQFQADNLAVQLQRQENCAEE